MNDLNMPADYEQLRKDYARISDSYEKIRHLEGVSDSEIKLAVFERLPMPIWACDRDCRIVFWNDGAARLYGYSVSEAIGKDFVDLFVNKPERAKARLDCIDIIDNDHPIRNMADDIDKFGNTRRLVTQCFAVYNVAGHSGLQIELSYEVQDIDRLRDELARLQSAYQKAEEERDELQKKLLEVTRTRALSALTSVFDAAKEAIRDRQRAVDQVALSKDADGKSVAKARADIKINRARLLAWEQEMRNGLMAQSTVEEIEKMIGSIERSEPFDV